MITKRQSDKVIREDIYHWNKLLPIKAKFFSRKLFTIALTRFLWIYFVLDLLCPSGWTPYRGNCYKHEARKVGWDQALKSCLQQNASLASIASESEHEFLTNLSMWSAPWIGLHDRSSTGLHSWIDGSRLVFMYSNWAVPRGPGSLPDLQCFRLSSPWTAWPCASNRAYLCAREGKPSKYNCSYMCAGAGKQ